jgi:hypothetical protein
MSKSLCYHHHHPLRAFPMMSSSDPTDSGSDSDVQIIAPSWDATAKGSSHYRVAFAILKGRSHGSPTPTLDTQRNHLKSFMGQPGGDYFTKYWLESTSNVPRIRKKCVKTILDPSTTPNTQKRVKTVFGKISKQSPGILTTIDDDLEFEDSQDAVAQLSLLYGDD